MVKAERFVPACECGAGMWSMSPPVTLIPSDWELVADIPVRCTSCGKSQVIRMQVKVPPLPPITDRDIKPDNIAHRDIKPDNGQA